MLRELNTPEVVVVALLLHQPAESQEHNPAKAAALAGAALDRLLLDGDARHAVEFLIASQQQMAQYAFRQDTTDPDIVGRFAAGLTAAAQLNSISAEEHLKMLCVLSVCDLGAVQRDGLTSWRAELLWRLYVDTYNHLTMAYADEVIDRDEAARTALHRDRPSDISDTDLVQFLEGLPQRYLTLFDPERVYQHVRLSRDLQPGQVHSFLSRKGEAWELTVVTFDQPYLFSHICGVLASLGADILRGQALTSRTGLVLDVFEFVDVARPVDRKELDRLLSEVVAGTLDIRRRLADLQRHPAGPSGAVPVLYFDNESSQRYTVLELVADDVPGLLYRASQALSSFGCAIALALISTEAERAVDVFHLQRNGQKLTDSDQLALTEHLERAITESGGGG
jgi:[protein-PII] uridylyltransferase